MPNDYIVLSITTDKLLDKYGHLPCPGAWPASYKQMWDKHYGRVGSAHCSEELLSIRQMLLRLYIKDNPTEYKPAL